MANIKFSAFTQKVATADVDFLVGYTGADNVRIAPTVFSDTYLPLAGGVMVGTLNLNDNVKAIWGGGSDLQIYHNATDSYITNTGGEMFIKCGDDLSIQDTDGTNRAIFQANAQKLYYNGVIRFETVSTGINLPSNNALFLDNTNNNNPVYFRNAGTNAATLQIGRGASPGSNISIEISTGGDVGIGVTPSYNLEVDGTATVATDPSYIVATAGNFEMAIGSRNAPGVAQEAFVGTLGPTDWKLKANAVDIGRFTQTGKFVIGRDALPASTIEAFTGGNTVHAAMLLQHDSFAAGRLCGIGFELGSTQIKAAIAVKADAAAIGTHGRSNIIFCVDSVDDANPVSHNDEKMRITHTGDVGIGIIPLAKFQVKCDTNVNFTTSENAGNLRINAVNDAVAATVGLEFNASDYEFLGTGASTFGGDVTLGSSTKATDEWLYIDSDASSSAGIQLLKAGASKWFIYNPGGTNNFKIYDNVGGGYMEIEPVGDTTFSGNIALASGKYITEIVPSGGGAWFAINHTGNESWTFDAQSGSGSDDYISVGISGGTRAMSWHDDGKVGIGTTVPTAVLQVVGLAEYADNATAIAASLTAGAFYRTGDLLKVVH